MTWKHLPIGHTDLESYLSSLAQEGDCLERNTSLAGALSATSNGTTTPNGSLRPESMTGCSMTRPSGTMCEPSMGNPGEGTSMSCRRGSHASHSALLVSKRPATTYETAGQTPFALLEKSGHDGSFWRTYQASLLPLMGISAPYSESWPKAGMMLGGVCYLQPKQEHRINAIESGLWLTPRAIYGEHPGIRCTKHLTGQVLAFPTPVAYDAPDRRTFNPTMTKSGQIRHRNKAGGTSRASLSQIVKMWPTPQARDGDQRGAQAKRYFNPKRSNDLPDAVAAFPTPSVNDSKNSTLPASPVTRDNLPGHLLRNGERPGGQLNPTWVAWLMGWPLEWTALKPLEMGKFRKWLQQHGDYLPRECEVTP